MTTLTTARLHLRPIEASDLDNLVSLDSDPEVMRFIGAAPSRDVVERELLPRMRQYADQPFGYYAAEAERGFIGWFHLRPSVADPAIHEIGYRLQRRSWGVGLATEGSLALCLHAFDALGMPAVDACALPENLASIRVMQKCGMSLVGRLTHPRGGMEVVRYLVTRATFEDRVRPGRVGERT
jgi:RimJ/RimL family protein N-acetyltransferase